MKYYNYDDIVILTCRVGAAIVVQVQEYSFPLSDLAMNPQCFLVFEDPQTSPESWDNVSIDGLLFGPSTMHTYTHTMYTTSMHT